MAEIIEREPTEEELAEAAVWEAGQHQRDLDAVANARRYAYQLESDPLFFQWQRGESTEQAWKDKVLEIQERYPVPVKP